jgi:hypothetical protein
MANQHHGDDGRERGSLIWWAEQFLREIEDGQGEPPYPRPTISIWEFESLIRQKYRESRIGKSGYREQVQDVQRPIEEE